jgi:hypothetical protein
MNTNQRPLLFRYRLCLAAFIIGLIVSGLTAFPLRTELSILSKLIGISDPAASVDAHGLRHWVGFVDVGLRETYARFPFFGYATDWLAFGHFVIAAFFVLPFVDPARYRGVLYVGLVACTGVILVALVCGPIRGIPFFWTLIDCSFGIFGAIPLLYCLQLTN